MPEHEVYEFGSFVLDVPERRLTLGTQAIAVAPKAFDLLAILVRQAGRLVMKSEMLDEVWPDAHVEEGILGVHISALRRALGDRIGERQYIQTVSGSGYRFVSQVTRRRPVQTAINMRWPIGVLPARPAVHELIGRGRMHLLSASMAEIPKAVEAFRSAIDLDPSYAAAHAGLALACCAQAELRVVPHADAYDEGRAAALRALAMDSGCADAQVALGAILFLSDWNWTGAERSLQRALELDPDHTDAYLLYGRLLEALGDLDQGLSAKQKALERNPASAQVHLQIALSYWNQRRYDEVIAWSTRALELDPRHLLAREYIASAYWKQGDYDRQMAESLAHAESYGVAPEALEPLKQAYSARGRAGVIEYGIQHASTQPAASVQLAVLFGELGNLHEAFRHLDVAIARRDPSLVHLAVAPQWDSLREDERFNGRLEGMGLPSPKQPTA